MNQSEVAGCTRSADAISRARGRERKRYLARGIIGHGARVVVVRPEREVVVVLLDVVNLGFRFNVAVLRRAHEYADTRAIDGLDIYARVFQSFVCAINPDAACASATPDVFARLITRGFKVALARDCLAEIANLIGRHAGLAGQQRLTKLRQRVAVGRRQANAGYHDAGQVHARPPSFLPMNLIASFESLAPRPIMRRMSLDSRVSASMLVPLAVVTKNWIAP